MLILASWFHLRRSNSFFCNFHLEPPKNWNLYFGCDKLHGGATTNDKSLGTKCNRVKRFHFPAQRLNNPSTHSTLLPLEIWRIYYLWTERLSIKWKKKTTHPSNITYRQQRPDVRRAQFATIEQWIRPEGHHTLRSKREIEREWKK